MWQHVKFDTVNFSAFFFSNLWVCFVSLFFLNQPINNLANTLTDSVKRDLALKNNPNEIYYWVLLLVYFGVVFLVMSMVMKPLNIHLPDNNVKGVETFITFVLILGFFFFTFHKTFNIGMPNGVPGFIVNLIMGPSSKYLDGQTTAAGASVLWSNISTFVWCFAPLGYMIFRAKTKNS
jgi:hypothetical protein